MKLKLIALLLLLLSTPSSGTKPPSRWMIAALNDLFPKKLFVQKPLSLHFLTAFDASIGKKVEVRDHTNTYFGKLLSYTPQAVVIQTETQLVTVPQNIITKISLIGQNGLKVPLGIELFE